MTADPDTFASRSSAQGVGTVPYLPVDEVRAAIESGDWSSAAGSIAQHHEELVQVLAVVDLATSPREPWHALLAAQHALLDELTAARDRVQAELAPFDDHNRGARAWLRELA